MGSLEPGLPPNEAKSSWFDSILSDEACLHFTIFITEVYLQSVHGQGGSRTTALAHFVKALGILRQRLSSSDNGLSTSDSTILVVIGLTMAATSFSDFDTARHHLKGLHKIVMLRGGVSGLNGNRPLQIKIFR